MFNIDYTTMITNLAVQLAVGGPVWIMVTAFSYVAGGFLTIKSAMQLKDVAEQKLQSYTAPGLTFLSAVLLMGLPSTLASVLVTVYGTGSISSPLAYGSADFQASPIKAVLTVIQTIGYFFFIRGILELRKAGEPQRFQGASVNKAAVIMLSGMAAIYINFTLQVIGSLTGWNVDSILN